MKKIEPFWRAFSTI